ncbi:hypothetical protein [Streptomyces sp. NPDC007205]|uniref:hypothetical protein n=1 Tax=Streptomyces sp. NPDC007205 TaxID=3154316 RepID=UPI0033EF10EF
MITTDAWVLHAGAGATRSGGELRRETPHLPDPASHEALVEPLLGGWEANMSHAIARSPADICRQRGEDCVLLGNCGIVRVQRPAAALRSPAEGQICLLMPFGKSDLRGYAELVHAYDAPGTYGMLATRVNPCRAAAASAGGHPFLDRPMGVLRPLLHRLG